MNVLYEQLGAVFGWCWQPRYGEYSYRLLYWSVQYLNEQICSIAKHEIAPYVRRILNRGRLIEQQLHSGRWY